MYDRLSIEELVAYLDMELRPLLVGLDDVAPVEEVVVVDHATAEVRLKKSEKATSVSVWVVIVA